jgi:hypothetical protein
MGTRKLFVRVGVFTARGNEDKMILAELERPPP